MRPTRPTRRGFTLIEMIVTIIVIVILAAIALPRLGANDSRNFDLVAEQVGDLLMMYAQRESLARRPVGLWHDAVNRRLVLVNLGVDDRTTDRHASWVPDQFVRPVVLPPSVRILDVQADGESVDISQWPLQVEPGENRPAIAITLEGADDVVTVSLASHALAPDRLAGLTSRDYVGGPVDLDAAGRDREDW